MGIAMKVLMMVSLVLCLISAAQAAQGNAVYYNPPYTKSACNGNRQNDPMNTGVSDELWDGGRACGRRYRVQCVRGANTAPHPCQYGKSVEVTVVDYCRQPCNGVLNLAKDAFAVIADPTAGKVVVEYTQI